MAVKGPGKTIASPKRAVPAALAAQSPSVPKAITPPAADIAASTVPSATSEQPVAKIPAVITKPAASVAKIVAKRAVAAEPAEIIQPVLKTAEPVTEIAMTETSTFTNTAHSAAEKASATFADLSQHGKAAFEKGSRVAEEMTDLTKGNVEAMVASSRAAAKGAEALLQSAADYGRRSFEHGTNALKTLTSAKTPAEFFQLHNEFAKSHFDQLVAETSKFSETFVKLAGEVAQPLSTRFSVAADKLKSAAKL